MTPFASVPRRTIEFETATTGSWGDSGVNPSEGGRGVRGAKEERGGAEAIGQNGMEQTFAQIPHLQPRLTPLAPPAPRGKNLEKMCVKHLELA